MREDGGSLGVEPLVTIRMVEVPVSVDQMLEWVAAKTVDGVHAPRACRCNARVDKHLAVRADQNRDTGALDDGDVAAQLVRLERRGSRGVPYTPPRRDGKRRPSWWRQKEWSEARAASPRN